MKVREFLERCPKTNQDKCAIVVYYDFHGRKKYPSVVSIHEDDVKVRHDEEFISICFKMPKDNEVDDSDTMSITEFANFCNENGTMNYAIEFNMFDGVFTHLFIPDEEDVYIPDGFDCVCLCY